jgi:hypothetical protein
MVIYITDHNKVAEIQRYLSLKTGINIQAFSVRHIDEIPKNSSGKTIYSGLSLK